MHYHNRLFLLHDMRSGAIDGWYTEITIARQALRSIKRLYPGGRWTLLEYVRDDRNKAWGIPEHRWHADVPPGGWHAEVIRLKAELAELRRWPTTPAAREAWLRTFGHLVVEGVVDLIDSAEQRLQWLVTDRDTMRDLMHGRIDERAAEAARNPEWPSPADDKVDDPAGGAR